MTANFDIREFVPPDVYDFHGAESELLLDARLPILMEKIRSLCGNKPIIINTWAWGGRFKYRGYRPPDCTVGAPRSMHKQGKAVDFDVKGLTAEQVRGVIRLNQIELMKLGLTRMETGVSWVHIDLKPTGLDYIKEFKP